MSNNVRIWCSSEQFASAWLSLVYVSDRFWWKLIKRIAHHETFTGLSAAVVLQQLDVFSTSSGIAKRITEKLGKNGPSKLFWQLGMTRANFKTPEMPKTGGSSLRYFYRFLDGPHQNGLLTTSPQWLLRVAIKACDWDVNWLIIGSPWSASSRDNPPICLWTGQWLHRSFLRRYPFQRTPAHFANAGWFLLLLSRSIAWQQAEYRMAFARRRPPNRRAWIVVLSIKWFASPGNPSQKHGCRIEFWNFPHEDWSVKGPQADGWGQNITKEKWKQGDPASEGPTSHPWSTYHRGAMKPGYGRWNGIGKYTLMYNRIAKGFSPINHYDVFNLLWIYQGEPNMDMLFHFQFTTAITGDVPLGGESGIEPALDHRVKRLPNAGTSTEILSANIEGSYFTAR